MTLTPSALPTVAAAVPVLACADLPATLRFYTETLGFEVTWFWGDPATDAGIQRGGANIHFMANSELATRVRGQEVMILVTGIDAIHAEHVGKGAVITRPITDEPWGLREYSVEDPCGYRLRFAQTSE